MYIYVYIHAQIFTNVHLYTNSMATKVASLRTRFVRGGVDGAPQGLTRTFICIYLCILYVYIYVMYKYIYIHVYIYTYTYISLSIYMYIYIYMPRTCPVRGGVDGVPQQWREEREKLLCPYSNINIYISTRTDIYKCTHTYRYHGN